MPPSPPCARSTGNRSPSISSWCSRPTRSKAPRTACSPRSNSPRARRRSAKARCSRRCPIAYPLVTAIKVGDIVEAAKALLGKLMTAIGATAGVTLLIGAAVLAGAVAAGQERRKYLAVIFKTLGATRARIIRAELLEFGLLGIATALLAVAIATLHRLGALQMGVRRGVRVLAACRRRDRPACPRSSCWRSAPSPPGGCCRPRRRLISGPNTRVNAPRPRHLAQAGSRPHIRGQNDYRELTQLGERTLSNMADLDRRYAQGTTVGRTDAGVVDQGLRAYMIRVYNYMAAAWRSPAWWPTRSTPCRWYRARADSSSRPSASSCSRAPSSGW